jgi:hypothetical protein
MARGVKFNIFERGIFCEYSNATHVHIAAILKIFLALKITYLLSRLNFFFIKMYSVSVKCLIFTLIIDFYLFFGQNIGGKELTIAKDHISKTN